MPRKIIIVVEDVEDGQVFRCEKQFTDTETRRWPWSTWHQILHSTIEDLGHQIDKEKTAKQK
jgi:hypothetical protein